jgi:hypothetical protein
MNDDDYVRGQRQVWASILSTAKQQLGVTGETVESLLAEREAAIEALRSVCEDFGDNDWQPDLHLADIIEKHLARVLHANSPDTK